MMNFAVGFSGGIIVAGCLFWVYIRTQRRAVLSLWLAVSERFKREREFNRVDGNNTPWLRGYTGGVRQAEKILDDEFSIFLDHGA